MGSDVFWEYMNLTLPPKPYSVFVKPAPPQALCTKQDPFGGVEGFGCCHHVVSKGGPMFDVCFPIPFKPSPKMATFYPTKRGSPRPASPRPRRGRQLHLQRRVFGRADRTPREAWGRGTQAGHSQATHRVFGEKLAFSAPGL